MKRQYKKIRQLQHAGLTSKWFCCTFLIIGLFCCSTDLLAQTKSAPSKVSSFPGEPIKISGVIKDVNGVLMNGVNAHLMRAVTHYDVTREQCAEAMDALEEVLNN